MIKVYEVQMFEVHACTFKVDGASTTVNSYFKIFMKQLK